ncbi:hypothetical protein F4677DRAFT_189436 [Hypoxylon crocopeplum]|nr:hypothetical protein F4677DRAFT_189436 [Hypoxylon crocopeplum]
MAPRQVIADSDDEDEDDIPLSPPREEVPDRPEIEPLSPCHRPSSPEVLDTHQISDTTDQSFFAGVYDEQQSRALHQSRLIENIVRQSQKASGSSGEVSLPAKGKGKKTNASSATDITSPVVLSRPGNQPSLFSDGASNITTPRKSLPGEWDVPSSAEGATTSRSAKSSKGKNKKSYGKQGRSQSKVVSSSAAAELFMVDDAALGETARDLAARDEMPVIISNRADPLLEPTAKKRKVSLHDSALQETVAPAGFYIAQSNLTTMQKLEYQRINVPQIGHPGLPGPLSNQKSSGMTTIAYSTPSRYRSSSGPPLPWERASAANMQPESPGVIDIASSPDVIAAGHDCTEKTAGALHMVAHTVREDETSTECGITKEIPNKRKRRSMSTQDEDELVQSASWAPEIMSPHKGGPKRQRNEQRPNSSSQREGDEEIELVQNLLEVVRAEKANEEFPKVYEADELDPEMPAAEIPIPVTVIEPDQIETQPTPQPKKRGRKKKLTVSEQAMQGSQSTANQATTQAQPPVTKDPEKPKKKRGRPRKSDVAKSETAVASELEVREDGAQCDELALEQTVVDFEKPKMKKQAQRQQEENETKDKPALHGDEGSEPSPFKEINGNIRTPSQKSLSTEYVPAVSVVEPSADQNLPSKAQEKGGATPKHTPTPTASPTASQAKVSYRVGLSKRTRIASLLKSIKR